MSSHFHHKNERIRKALAKRLKRKALEIYDEENRRGFASFPDEVDFLDSGDGRVVRKTINDEGDTAWDD